ASLGHNLKRDTDPGTPMVGRPQDLMRSDEPFGRLPKGLPVDRAPEFEGTPCPRLGALWIVPERPEVALLRRQPKALQTHDAQEAIAFLSTISPIATTIFRGPT